MGTGRLQNAEGAMYLWCEEQKGGDEAMLEPLDKDKAGPTGWWMPCPG